MQREFFGFDSIHELENLCDEFNAKNVFLVTGKNSFIRSGAEQKTKAIFEKLKITQFNRLSTNPNIDEVEKGINVFRKTNPDIVVAIGGGSTIDIAKAINTLAVHDKKPILYLKGEKHLKKTGKPLIAIPTTAGTGSEATSFATVYIEKEKFSLDGKKLTLPTVAIIDPSLTESMPKYITASTGLDALCQGIESLWSVKSTYESRKYARTAIELAFNNLEKAVDNPDKKTRMNMAKAANLSGKAINISKTTACHSISYPITSYFGIAHGHAVAVTMPEIIKFNSRVSQSNCNDRRGVDFVKKRLKEIFKLFDCENEYDTGDRFKELMKNIGIETSLTKMNINRDGVKTILEKGFTPDRMNNNPRIIHRDDLKVILKEIL